MKMNPPKVRVLIVDAEPVWRLGLRQIAEREAEMEVVAEAGSVREARGLCEKVQPEVVAIDVGMEGGEGFFLLEELPRWCRGARAVAFCRAMDGRTVERALRGRACGVVSKEDGVMSVLLGLLGAAAGSRYLGPGAEEALCERVARGALRLLGEEEAALTVRELQVFRLLGEGRQTRAVAETLRLSVKTIETHYERMKRKVGVRAMAELRGRAVAWVSAPGRQEEG